MQISVFGLGKLGAPISACFAAKGFQVVGVDVDESKVTSLNQGKAPVYEPGLQELLKAHGDCLTGTTNGVKATLETDVTFVVVPTPSKPNGSFSLDFVLNACGQIGTALRQKDTYHLVVITSTISPGSMGNTIQPCLEQVSGKRSGKDFGLCYSPEFIALGSVIRDFLNPDFILLGESDPKAGEILAGIYRRVCENNPPVARMNFVNAELTKIAVNTFVTTKISFANMLARICERLPGADVDVVTQALGMDSRIGPRYLKGALSYGGPCFPRDNLALIALARSLGVPADIAEATDRFNRMQIRWLANEVKRYLPDVGTVGILGLTYKPNTDVVEEAVGLLLARELTERGIQVVAYDPAGNRHAERVLGESVRFAGCAEECVRSADVVVLTTVWKEFLMLPQEVWVRHSPPRVVMDCWRALRSLEGQSGVTYIPLGRHWVDQG